MLCFCSEEYVNYDIIYYNNICYWLQVWIVDLPPDQKMEEFHFNQQLLDQRLLTLASMGILFKVLPLACVSQTAHGLDLTQSATLVYNILVIVCLYYSYFRMKQSRISTLPFKICNNYCVLFFFSQNI